MCNTQTHAHTKVLHTVTSEEWKLGLTLKIELPGPVGAEDVSAHLLVFNVPEGCVWSACGDDVRQLQTHITSDDV